MIFSRAKEAAIHNHRGTDRQIASQDIMQKEGLAEATRRRSSHEDNATEPPLQRQWPEIGQSKEMGSSSLSDSGLIR